MKSEQLQHAPKSLWLTVYFIHQIDNRVYDATHMAHGAEGNIDLLKQR